MMYDSPQPRADRHTPTPVVACEPLEGRRLLSSAGFAAKVNFQTTTSETPSGYIADIGRAYALRRSGHVFGWTGGHEPLAADQDSSRSPDQRYDTFNLLRQGHRWAMRVPDGRYRVRVVAGDPDASGERFRIDVEGSRIIDGRTTTSTHWLDGTGTLDVTDGILTIKPGAGSNGNKLAFVEITGIDDGSTTAGGTARISWGQTNSSPRGRVEAGAIQAGRKFYLIGGYNSDDQDVTRAMDVLDLGTDRWSRGPNIPSGAAQTHAGYAFDGRRFIYWIGGQLGSSSDDRATRAGWRFDTVKNQWGRWIDAPAVRYAPGLAYVNGTLHLFGGDDSSRFRATSDHWSISTTAANARWVERPSLPRPSDHMGVAVVGGRIYSIGGEHDHGRSYQQHRELFVFDPAANRWDTKADLPTPSSHFEGTIRVIGNRYILAIGGRVNAQTAESREVRLYDIARDRWSILASLPEGRLGGAAALVGNRVYMTTGYSPEFGIANESYWGTLRGI